MKKQGSALRPVDPAGPVESSCGPFHSSLENAFGVSHSAHRPFPLYFLDSIASMRRSIQY